jgi:hypothetical protein
VRAGFRLARIVVRRVVAPVTLAVGLAVSVVLALAGPFGTYGEMSLVARLGYWGLIVFTSIPFGYATRYATALVLPRATALSVVILPSVLMVLTYTPVVFLIVRHLGAAGGSALGLGVWLAWLVLVISVCINGVRWAMGRTATADLRRLAPIAAVGTPVPVAVPVAAPVAVPVAPMGATPRIVARLAGLPCTEVLRLTARDHYVDVITRRAQTSLLMRLSDAMAEMDGIPGAQVHRSHWVARAAVAGVRRSGTRLVLDLVDGSSVPVSRGYRDRAEAAGLLRGLRPEELAAAE